MTSGSAMGIVQVAVATAQVRESDFVGRKALTPRDHCFPCEQGDRVVNTRGAGGSWGQAMATAPSTSPRVRWLLAATPVMVVLAHDAAVLPHEFSHSVVVWLVDTKDQPGNIYDDVSMRVFSDDGDVHNVIHDTGTNSWVIYVVGSYLVAWGIVDFFRNTLPLGLQLSDFFTPTARGVTLIVATVLLFGYFADPSLLVGPDPRLQALAVTSIMAILPVVILRWPRIVTPPAAL